MEKIIKSLRLKAKDIDETKRTIAFYIARKNIPDLNNDIFMEGSIFFDPNNLRHFKNHNYENLIGKVISIEEDDTGFFAVSKILPTTLGNDTLIEYVEGAINQHSIGGYIRDYQIKGEFWLIKSFELLEVSSLTTWAAQPDTPVISIKSKPTFFDKLFENYEKLKKQYGY